MHMHIIQCKRSTISTLCPRPKILEGCSETFYSCAEQRFLEIDRPDWVGHFKTQTYFWPWGHEDIFVQYPTQSGLAISETLFPTWMFTHPKRRFWKAKQQDEMRILDALFFQREFSISATNHWIVNRNPAFHLLFGLLLCISWPENHKMHHRTSTESIRQSTSAVGN